MTLALSSILFFFSLLIVQDYYRLMDKQHTELNSHFELMVSELQSNVEKSMTFIYGLEGFTYSMLNVELNQDMFDEFASRAQMHDAYIKNFSIAPDAIQKYVYPLEGNEVTLGHNLLTDTRENVVNDVMKAFNTRQMVISGPYELRQGGLGMVIRNPIFVNDQAWGLVNVVIDVQSILEDSTIYTCHSLDLALKKDGDYFWGHMDTSNVRLAFQVGQDEWIAEGQMYNILNQENFYIFLKNSILLMSSLFIVIAFIIYILRNNTRLSEKIHILVYHDTLTNLPNRRSLDEKMDVLIKENQRFCIGFLDLDNFKDVNDRLGHASGDLLLKEIADRIKAFEKIEVFRWGGDEFILLGLMEMNEFESIVKEIQAAISHSIMLIDQKYTITSSIGVCHFPDHARSKEQLLNFADQTMYIVKEQGKNSYQIFSRI